MASCRALRGQGPSDCPVGLRVTGGVAAAVNTDGRRIDCVQHGHSRPGSTAVPRAGDGRARVDLGTRGSKLGGPRSPPRQSAGAGWRSAHRHLSTLGQLAPAAGVDPRLACGRDSSRRWPRFKLVSPGHDDARRPSTKARRASAGPGVRRARARHRRLSLGREKGRAFRSRHESRSQPRSTWPSRPERGGGRTSDRLHREGRRGHRPGRRIGRNDLRQLAAGLGSLQFRSRLLQRSTRPTPSANGSEV